MGHTHISGPDLESGALDHLANQIVGLNNYKKAEWHWLIHHITSTTVPEHFTMYVDKKTCQEWLIPTSVDQI